MRVRLQALAMIALLGLGCRSDVHIRLLEPAQGPRAGTGAAPSDDAGHAPGGSTGGGGGIGGGGGGIGGTGGRPSGSGGRRAIDAGGTDVDGGVLHEDAGGASNALEALIVRYDFSGTGDVVVDRVGDADAHLIGGAVLDGDGGVTLDGTDDYVDMPNHIVSVLQSASFVTWLEWSGGYCWQRIFDFGNNDAGEGEIGNATSSMFLAATSCNATQLIVRAEFPSSEHVLHANGPLPSGRLVQVAMVLDAAQDSFALYLDGEQIAKARAGFELNAIDDVNNWLGRSQWVQDRNLRGRYDEFRIYAAALTSRDIATLYARGPDQP